MWKRRKFTAWALILICIAGCGGPYSSGDRVLVSKFNYDSGVKHPNRYDVVVFKYPERPVEHGVFRNYIKRLLGLPGEILAIFFGQLFVFPVQGGTPPFNDHEDPNVNPNDLWRLVNLRDNDPKSQKLFETPGNFQILRKPLAVMLAMRRIVYDNDYHAKDLPSPTWRRWAPAQKSGWTTSDHKVFQHSANSTQTDWLRYRHITRPDNAIARKLLPGTEPQKRLITDFVGYNLQNIPGNIDANNDGIGQDNYPFPVLLNWVGDLMLECDVDVKKSAGEFRLELSRSVYRFQARFNLADGMCTLVRIEPESMKDGEPGPAVEKELAKAKTSLTSPGNYRLRFANFDARLTVWVDRQLPFGDGHEYPPPELPQKAGDSISSTDSKLRRGPYGPNDFEPASIGSNGAEVEINHLRLWRDTYYTLNPGSREGRFQDAADYVRGTVGFDTTNHIWSDPDEFHKLRNLPYKTMYVQPGHYLCLGDNSASSADSRSWGLVPERLMLGRALMVYYPFNRFGPIH